MSRRVKSIALGLALCGLAAVATGCWDYRDLERRSSVMGMGVDKTTENGASLYRVTVEIPHPSGAGPSGGIAQGGGGDGGGESPPPKVVTSGEGSTFGAALISLSSRIERLPLWEHLLAVVVSESAAREGLSPIIDALARSTMLNSRARLYITENRAEDVIAFVPLMHPLTSQFLRGLEEQFAEFPRFHRPQDVHSLDRRLEETNAALLPRIALTEGNIVAEGATVIHHGRLAGWLDPIATEGTNWWLGQVKSAIVEFPCPDGNGREPVTVRARAARSALTARIERSPRLRRNLRRAGPTAGRGPLSFESGRSGGAPPPGSVCGPHVGKHDSSGHKASEGDEHRLFAAGPALAAPYARHVEDAGLGGRLSSLRREGGGDVRHRRCRRTVQGSYVSVTPSPPRPWPRHTAAGPAGTLPRT